MPTVSRPLHLVLYNGSHTRDAWNPASADFIDDWKPERRIIDCDAVVITYGEEARVIRDSEEVEYPFTDDGFLFVDGVYYGDLSIEPRMPSLILTRQQQIDIYDALDAAIEDYEQYQRSEWIDSDSNGDPEYAPRVRARTERWREILNEMSEDGSAIAMQVCL